MANDLPDAPPPSPVMQGSLLTPAQFTLAFERDAIMYADPISIESYRRGFRGPAHTLDGMKAAYSDQDEPTARLRYLCMTHRFLTNHLVSEWTKFCILVPAPLDDRAIRFERLGRLHARAFHQRQVGAIGEPIYTRDDYPKVDGENKPPRGGRVPSPED